MAYLDYNVSGNIAYMRARKIQASSSNVKRYRYKINGDYWRTYTASGFESDGSGYTSFRWTISGLPYDSRVSVYAEVEVGTGNWHFIDEVSFWTDPSSGGGGGGGVPSRPSGLAVTNIGTASASIDWSSTSGATSYSWELYASGSRYDWGTTYNNYYDPRSLSPGQSYTFYVSACNSYGCSSEASSSFITLGGGPSLNTPTLYVSNIEQTRLIASIGNSTPNAQYIVQASTSQYGDYYWYGQSSSTAFWIESGFSAGNTYYLRAFAQVGSQTSGYSNIVTVTMLAALSAPSLIVDSITQTSLRVTASGGSNVSQYLTAVRKLTGSSWGSWVDYTGSTSRTWYITSGFTAGDTYQIQIRGQTGSTYTAFSNIVTVTMLAALSAPSLSIDSVTQNSLRMVASGGSNVSQYLTAARKLTGGSWGAWMDYTGSTSRTWYITSGLTMGETYQLQIRGQTGSTYTPFSNAVTVTMLALPVPISPLLSSGGQTISSATLNISSYGTATHFHVQMRSSTNYNWAIQPGNYYNPTTIGGLTSGVTYDFQVRGVNATGAGPWSNILTFSIGAVKPGPWNWSYSIYSGGPMHSSSTASSAILMPASEWNNYTARVNQMRLHKGLSTYPFATAYSGSSGSAVTSIVQSGINGLNSMLSSQIPGVSSGQTVMASTFILLRDRYNSL